MLRIDWRDSVAKLFGKDRNWLAPISDVIDDQSCWFSSDLPETRVIHLPSVSSTVSGILSRADGGSLLPLHRHDCRETVLVLRGGFVEEQSGKHVGPGQALISEPGTEHSIRVDPGGDCIVAVRMDFVVRPKDSGIDLGLEVVGCNSPKSETGS